jgi:hypothetical protein
VYLILFKNDAYKIEIIYVIIQYDSEEKKRINKTLKLEKLGEFKYKTKARIVKP